MGVGDGPIQVQHQQRGCKSATTDLSASCGVVEQHDHHCGDDLVLKAKRYCYENDVRPSVRVSEISRLCINYWSCSNQIVTWWAWYLATSTLETKSLVTSGRLQIDLMSEISKCILAITVQPTCKMLTGQFAKPLACVVLTRSSHVLVDFGYLTLKIGLQCMTRLN